jgi:hypothetical protein
MKQMTARSALLPAALAILLGAADWELIRQFGSRREAWDDPLYWQLGYPLLLLALIAGQVAWSLALALRADGVPNLLPLGLMMFALLGIPCVLAAYAGKWVGEKLFA